MDQPSSTEDSGITVRIRFRSETLDHFIARYGADVSPGGIFIRTREPLSVGADLRFEFTLADGTPLLVGAGTVVWIREPEPPRPGMAPGMGVRFDKLTANSQKTLGAILMGKAKRDRESPGAVGAAPPSVGPAASQARQQDPAAMERTELARLPQVADAAATVVAPRPLPTERHASGNGSPRPPNRPSTPVQGLGGLSGPGRSPTPGQGVGTTPPPPPPGAQGRIPTPASGTSTPSTPAGASSSPVSPANPAVAAPQASGDPFSREAPGPSRPGSEPSRGKMVAVISLAALATAGIGVYLLQTRLLVSLPPTPVAEEAQRPGTGAAPARTEPAPSSPKSVAPAEAERLQAAATGPKAASPPAAAAPPQASSGSDNPPALRRATPARNRRRTARVAPAPAIDPAPSEPSAETPVNPAAEPSVPSEPAAQVHWLHVRSTPAGAEVLIDGRIEGKTPLQRRIFDVTRPYAVVVRKPGFEPFERVFSASDEWVREGDALVLTIAPTLAPMAAPTPTEPAPGTEPSPTGGEAATPPPQRP